jgi:signal transduction histidine kinase
VRRQVVVLVTATTLLVLLAFLLPLTVLLRTLAVDRAVAEATKEAQNLAVLVAVADPGQLDAAVTLTNQRGDRRVGLVLPDGRSFGPTDPGMPQSLALALAGRSFTIGVPGGRQVYVPVDTARGRAVVRSFVPNRLLHNGVTPAVTVLVALGVGLLLLTVFLADRLASGTVRPMKDLERTALALGRGDLSARAAVGGPHEVREVAHAVNVLAQRIGELLVAERESVADLSHRLRTPLTALRLDVESVDDMVHRVRLLEHLDALQRTVDEVIREARRPVREGVLAECDAAQVVADRVRFWSVLMVDQGRPLDLDVRAAPDRVRTTAEDLGAAVDALLQNALLHTPDGTAVRVAVTPAAERCTTVVVTDEGPGYRVGAVDRGHSTSGSTGLGLDIARRTAESSGGRLVLGRSAEGGASATLVLGPALRTMRRISRRSPARAAAAPDRRARCPASPGGWSRSRRTRAPARSAWRSQAPAARSVPWPAGPG